MFNRFSTTQSMEQGGKSQNMAQEWRGEMAEDLLNRDTCLPSGTAMTNAHLDRIISVFRRCHK